jgi:hypothetical protein
MESLAPPNVVALALMTLAVLLAMMLLDSKS